MIVASFVSTQYQRVTEGQTDRQTDRRTDPTVAYTAVSIASYADALQKNTDQRSVSIIAIFACGGFVTVSSDSVIYQYNITRLMKTRTREELRIIESNDNVVCFLVDAIRPPAIVCRKTLSFTAVLF